MYQSFGNSANNYYGNAYYVTNGYYYPNQTVYYGNNTYNLNSVPHYLPYCYQNQQFQSVTKPYVNNNKFNKKKPNNHSNETLFSCNVCNLYFDKRFKFENHLKNDHIQCLHEGCTFSASIEILEAHSLKHLTNEKGESIVDSPEEIMIWRNRRRANHPLNPNRNQPSDDSTCQLEELLRSTINLSSKCKFKMNEEEVKHSALIPLLNKIRPTPKPQKTDKRITAMEARFGGPYSYSSSLKKRLNVCRSFLKYKTCKYGSDCTYSHDISAFRGGKRCQNSLQVPKRPPLLYRLLKPEILVYEETLIKGIVYIVKSNFFQTPKIPLIEELN